MIAIPGPTFPLIAKNFIELWTSWSLQIPRTPNPNTALCAFKRSKTKFGSQLSGWGPLAKFLCSFSWTSYPWDICCWFELCCRQEQESAPESPFGLSQTGLVTGFTAPLQQGASCIVFLFYYHYSSPESINTYFVQKRVWHFQKGKGGNEETLKLLNTLQTITKIILRAANSWDIIK